MGNQHNSIYLHDNKETSITISEYSGESYLKGAEIKIEVYNHAPIQEIWSGTLDQFIEKIIPALTEKTCPVTKGFVNYSEQEKKVFKTVFGEPKKDTWSIVYKEVEEKDGRYFSLMVIPGYTLEYQIGQTTVPTVGKLFARGSLESCVAKHVLRCFAKNVTPQTTNAVDYWQPIFFKDFWAGRLTDHMFQTPNAEAVLCEEIIPLEVVR